MPCVSPREARDGFSGPFCVDAALKAGTKRFVAISTDKAVSPTGIMGASKRMADTVARDAGRRSGRAFVVVRFGNVLGRRGSVVPFFKAQKVAELQMPAGELKAAAG